MEKLHHESSPNENEILLTKKQALDIISWCIPCLPFEQRFGEGSYQKAMAQWAELKQSLEKNEYPRITHDEVRKLLYSQGQRSWDEIYQLKGELDDVSSEEANRFFDKKDVELLKRLWSGFLDGNFSSSVEEK